MSFEELKEQQKKRLEEFEANRQEALIEANKQLEEYKGNDFLKSLQVRESNNLKKTRFDSHWDQKKITILEVQKIELEHYIENLEIKIEADKRLAKQLEEMRKNEVTRKGNSGMSL